MLSPATTQWTSEKFVLSRVVGTATADMASAVPLFSKKIYKKKEKGKKKKREKKAKQRKLEKGQTIVYSLFH